MLFFAHNFPAIDRQSNSVISIMSEGETLLQKKKKSLIARPGTSILCSIKQAIHWLFCSGVAAVVFSITGFGVQYVFLFYQQIKFQKQPMYQ